MSEEKEFTCESLKKIMKHEDLFILYFDISQDKDNKINPKFYLNIYFNKYLK